MATTGVFQGLLQSVERRAAPRPTIDVKTCARWAHTQHGMRDVRDSRCHFCGAVFSEVKGKRS